MFGIKRKELFNVLIFSIIILIININPLMVNGAFYSVSSNIEKYRIDYLTQEFLTDSSDNFVYKYMPSDKDILNMVKESTEKNYNSLSKIFGYTAKDKIKVIIFPSKDYMNSILRLPKQQRAMGIYSSGLISILSPKEWIAADDKKMFENIFNNTGPIAHELTHYFVDKKTNGNYPAWFTEGVALFFEKQLTGYEWGKGVKYKQEPYSIEELTNRFEKLDQDYAYRRSYEIIYEYVKENGVSKLLDTMKKLGEGYTLEGFDK